jgi:hypothetical protein
VKQRTTRERGRTGKRESWMGRKERKKEEGEE